MFSVIMGDRCNDRMIPRNMRCCFILIITAVVVLFGMAKCNTSRLQGRSYDIINYILSALERVFKENTVHSTRCANSSCRWLLR